MFNFFKKKAEAKKANGEPTTDHLKSTNAYFLLVLQKEVNSYPAYSLFRYKQERANYLKDFLQENVFKHNTGDKADVKEQTLKKIVLEIYLHYLSIRQRSQYSKLGESLRKALIGILNIDKKSMDHAIGCAVQGFTNVYTKPLLFHADQLSEEEESPSLSGAFLVSKGGNALQMKFLCVNASRAINAMINTPRRTSFNR